MRPSVTSSSPRSTRPQLPPAAGGHRPRRGSLGDRRRRPALPRLPGRLLRAELRPPPPAAHRRRPASSWTAHADQPGVPPRPARRRSAEELAELAGKELVLPMNTGAEAVETAIKVARKWGYEVKGVPDDQAKIIVAARQLPRPHDHDRQLLRPTRTRATDFGPYTPGFRVVPYGDLDALRGRDRRDHRRGADRADPGRGRRPRAAARLPARACASSAREQDVLFVADEIQSGLGRTGQHVRLRPRGRRARHVPARQGARRRRRAGLGGGRRPRRARRAHARASTARTFGGNPLACAVGRAVVGCSRPASSRSGPASWAAPARRAAARWSASGVTAVRGRGLWAGVDIDPAAVTGREALRAAAGARRAGQGHPRLDDPARPAARGHRGRAGHPGRVDRGRHRRGPLSGWPAGRRASTEHRGGVGSWPAPPPPTR